MPSRSPKDSLDGGLPEGQTLSIEHSTFGQGIRDLSEHHPLCKGAVHEAYRLSFLLDNLKTVDYPSIIALKLYRKEKRPGAFQSPARSSRSY